MSIREDIQREVEEFLSRAGLNEVYGVIGGLHSLKSGKKIRVVTFCRARTLDGTVEIYSPSFIRVRTVQHGIETFGSAKHALAYIQARFVDYDMAVADSIPRKA